VVHDRFFRSIPLGLLALLDERREVRGLDDRPRVENPLLAILADDDVVLAPVVVEGREVEPAVGTAALLAQPRGTRHSPEDDHHIPKVAAQMPARVVDGRTRRCNDLGDTPVEFVELIQDRGQPCFVAKDAGVLVHRGLQLGMESIWIFDSRSRQVARHLAAGLRQVRFVDPRRRRLGGVLRRTLARPLSEYEQVRERVAAQPVGSVDPT
jgi:hypothetical protein